MHLASFFVFSAPKPEPQNVALLAKACDGRIVCLPVKRGGSNGTFVQLAAWSRHSATVVLMAIRGGTARGGERGSIIIIQDLRSNPKKIRPSCGQHVFAVSKHPTPGVCQDSGSMCSGAVITAQTGGC